jgi:hypothetical protein
VLEIKSKKRKTYLIVISFILLGTGYLEIQHAIFNKYSIITALIDSSRGDYKIVIVGEQDMYDNYRIIIAPRFHFRFTYYGCNTSFVITNGIEDYNAWMIKKIKLNNGKDWEVKFRNELIKLIVKDESVKNRK